MTVDWFGEEEHDDDGDECEEGRGVNVCGDGKEMWCGVVLRGMGCREGGECVW